MPLLTLRLKNNVSRRGVGLGMEIFFGLIVVLDVLWIVVGDMPSIGFTVEGGWNGVAVSLAMGIMIGAVGWWLRRPQA